MGVPKFFRWCAERYPSIITPFKEHPPPIDNFYIDFNGIIHNCTHSDGVDPMQKSPSEEKMIQLMFIYLEKLFMAIQPRKYFFLAVDGVAPRAKMNQQRQRRYRSAFESMVARKEAIENGLSVPDESDTFDSNCITPGTVFMMRVNEALSFFITKKLSTDPGWQNCHVILSGHDNPGEGEHKIIDFIRGRKMQPGYNPNETHCMYGLDADLIMLALATHEPHFVLLREVVSFGGKTRREKEREEEDAAKGIGLSKSYSKEDEFVLFHINMLRNYLQMDVGAKLSAFSKSTFDLEKVIDDFVFMLFFVGNDFLPTIPTLSIHDQGLVKMFELYAQHILSKNLYLISNGLINWHAVEILLSSIGKLEFETIKDRQSKEAEFHAARSRRDRSYEAPSTAAVVFTSIEEYKKVFYEKKHNISTENEMQSLRRHYVEGLLWVFAYYFQGVSSWKWFYPHYYAPMASDLVNLPAIAARVSFELGEPFLPHQQLLAVLPPMSYRSIPRPYWPLLKSSSSPLAPFYPEEIQIDREGTRAAWEGIVLIPFIDEKILLKAYKSVQTQVDVEDNNNNRLGPAFCYSFDKTIVPYDLKSDAFGTLRGVFVRKQVHTTPRYDRFKPDLCEGVYIGDKELEGFSSLQSKIMLITPTYESCVVELFGRPSKEQSLILNLKSFSSATTAEEAAGLIGKEVLVGFPHYKRARVASLGDVRATITAVYNRDGSLSGTEKHEKNRDESMLFLKEADAHRKYMKMKLGISVDDIPILVYVNRFFGMRVSTKGYLARQFSSSLACYPLPLICLFDDIKMIEDTRYTERERAEVDSGQGSSCIYIGPEPKTKDSISVFGSCGHVFSVGSNTNVFEVSLKIPRNFVKVPPRLLEFASTENWVALHVVADDLGLSSRTLSTICGSITTSPQFGSRELGLCIKLTGRSLARVGYAKMVQRSAKPWYISNIDVFSRIEQEENVGHHLEKVAKGEYVGKHAINNAGTWYLSKDAIKLLNDYVKHFSPLVDVLEKGLSCPQLDPPQFMTGKWQECDADEIIDSISAFLDDSGIKENPMITATEDAFPPALVEELEAALDEQDEVPPMKSLTLRQVPKNYLYFPITRSVEGRLVPIPLPREQTFRLGARVVNCRAAGIIPFGARGTIIRLLASGRDAEVVYDIPLTSGSHFDGRLKDNRGSITKLSALLVLKSTDGDRLSTNSGALTKNVAQTPSCVASRTSPNESRVKAPTGSAFVPKPRSAIVTASMTTPTDHQFTPVSHTSPGSIHANIQSPNAGMSNMLSLSSSSPTGGIRLSELVSCLPTFPSPTSNIIGPNPVTADLPKPFPTPSSKSLQQQTSGKGPIPGQPQGLNLAGPLIDQNGEYPHQPKNPGAWSSKLSRMSKIPDEFMSGKIRVSHRESGDVFKECLTLSLEAEMKDL